MITRKQKYKFVGSSEATNITYSIVGDNDCVSITPSSDTVAKNTTVEFTFSFEDESCFSTQFTITTVDDSCVDAKTTSFYILNPCGTLSGSLTNTPSSTNPFIFNLIVSGGNPSYTVDWQYDNVLFNLLSSTGSGSIRNLQLSPKYLTSNVIVPSNTTIRANITDNSNCTETIEYEYTFCQPVGHNDFITLNCIPSQTISGSTVYSGLGNVELTATTCAGTTNDWSTLQLSYDTSKLIVLNTNEFITVYSKQNLTSAANIPITFSVENSVGIRSTDKTVMVQVPICQDTSNSVVVQNKTTKLVTGDTTGTIKYLDVDSITFDLNA